jgi:hypothetical protein
MQLRADKLVKDEKEMLDRVAKAEKTAEKFTAGRLRG